MAFALGACGPGQSFDEWHDSTEAETFVEEGAVVGGQAESQYSSVGYLGFLDGEWQPSAPRSAEPPLRAHCGATLVTPAMAVTAAHRLDTLPPRRLQVVGFGTLAEKRWV